MDREPFKNQSPVYFLLQYTADTTEKTAIKLIYQSLEELLAIAAGISGAPRIPGIGCGILGQPFQQILPLTAVKGGLDTILTKLQKLLEINVSDPMANPQHLINEALPYILQMAEDFMPEKMTKLKLIVITWECAKVMINAISSFIKQEQTLCLSAVKVYEMEDPLPTNLIPKQVEELMETSLGVQIIGDIIELTPFAINLIFKKLLLEHNGEKPHVILVFQGGSEPNPIYFDTQESSIDPSLLPWGITSKICPTMNDVRTVTTTTGTAVAIWDLEVLRMYNIKSLSMYWLCGPILHMIPSAAEKLSLDEYLSNSEEVSALYDRLNSTQVALLCRQIPKSSTGTPLAHAVLIPFNKTLLLVHVMPPELVLCESFPPIDDKPSEQSQKRIDRCLEGLEKSDFRIQDLYSSSLVPALINHSVRPQRNTSGRSRGNGSSHPVGPVRPTARAPGRRTEIRQHPCYVRVSTEK